jgi:hypothetical protein
MAQRIVIVDDLTGEAGATTRHICFDGVDYEIDLTDASFARLRDDMRRYLEVARVATKSSARGSRGTPIRRKQVIPSPSATIRAWADANGVDCPARGRIPATVVEAYEQAMDIAS